jgi:predicted HTH transcriptional regulator
MIRPQEIQRFNLHQFRELKRLVATGEGKYLEFKRKAAYPEKIVREMIAFANTGGGIVLVGIGDDGSIPGLKFPEDESHMIRQALKHCRPLLHLREIFIPVGNSRTVIQYDIPESRKKSHYMLTNSHTKEFFVRVEDKSIKASREVREIAKRKLRKQNIRFHYGDHERILMQYLDIHESITLKKFIELTGLRKYNASQKLILLVLANVLKITPHEKGDQYTLGFRAH